MSKMENMDMFLFDSIDNISLPFVLYIPKNINQDSSLILNGITPNQKGSYRDSIEEAKRVAMEQEFSPIYKKLAVDYNNPMLIPIIPRCTALYTGYLGYDIYHENFERAIQGYNEGWSDFSPTDLNNFRKLDFQISNMIEYCLFFIKSKYNLELDNKVIATGYSASSKMVNYFAALHPNQVKMVIGGGTGGLCILPIKKYNETSLDYPIGFNDLGDEKLEMFKEIPQFYYIGKDDQTSPNSFVREIEYDGDNPRKDYMGNTIHKKENGQFIYRKDKNNKFILSDGGYYSYDQALFILYELSDDVQERFDKEQKIYESTGVNALFKKYNGNHIIEDSNLVLDVISFYQNYIKKLPNKKV